MIVAYWAHLLVPLCLFFDTLRGPIAGAGLNRGTVVLGASGLWILLGTLFGILSWNRPRLLQAILAPLVCIYACYLGLFLLELSARYATRNWKMTLYDPGTILVLHPDPSLLGGIGGVSHFSVNEVGLRGPSLPKQKDVYKIVTVGGSTTECYYLDDSKTWPALVMDQLNNGQPNVHTWVANAGLSGHTTVEHLSLLQNLPNLRDANMLVFLIGANDLNATIAFGGAPTQSFLDTRAGAMVDSLRTGTTVPYPAYNHLRSIQVMRKIWHRVSQSFDPPGITEGPKGDHLPRLRALRAAGPVVPLPDLRIGLREYHDRIAEIGRECRALATRCLFLTQPSLMRPDLSLAGQSLLWFGNVGRLDNPKGYVGVAEFANAMDAYNRVVMTTCQDQHLECYDLASVVPKEIANFYDDYHFNEEGARIVAANLSRYILSTPPFSTKPSVNAAEPQPATSRAAGQLTSKKLAPAGAVN